MSKFAAIPAMFVLLFAGTVSAQVYSYPGYGGASSVGLPAQAGCVALTSSLSYGSRGGEVTKLQQFLVTQNYPGGGSWMVTGYFGNATVQAVRNFQQTASLSMTGYVDAATRAAIQGRTCSGAGVAPISPMLPPSYTLPTPTTYTTPPYTPTYTTPPYTPPTTVPPYAPSYPFTPNYPYSPYPYGGVSISSLSTQNAQVGTSVTISGNGFDMTATNTIHIGTATVVAASTDGTSITFTVPAMSGGMYSIYVTNSRGTSNSITLSVSQVQSVCNPAPWYQPWNWFGQQYQCGVYSNVVLNSISPNWAVVGATITVKGNGFSPNGNAVYMGGSIVTTAASSNNGTELTFTVPTHLSGPYGSQPLVPGHYPIRVVNATGAESNSLTLSITQSSASLSISRTSGPSSLQTAQQGVWTLVVTASYGAYLTTTVNWGDNTSAQTSTGIPGYLAGTQTLTFTHAYPNPGTFTINFSVSSGGNTTTATKTVTVTAAPSGDSLNISALSPMQGAVGTTVIINGSGFTSGDTIVHFGMGGLRNVPSSNSNQISYVIPSYISACDLVQPGYFCGAPTQTVTPGVYPIYVQNENGASNILYFTVQ